jgi:hypothetical protein
MKDKKKWVYVVIGVVALIGLVAYLIWGRTKVTEKDGVTQVEKDRIVTETVTYIRDDISYAITKNKITKTASVKISYPIPDDDEIVDFFGEKVTMVPFTVNFSCVIFNAAFFDIEGYNEIISSFGNEEASEEAITEDEEFLNKLGDYKVTEFYVDFFDAENQEKIAMCKSKEKGNENIKFEAFRDYADMKSFFGAQIGVFEEKKEETGL